MYPLPFSRTGLTVRQSLSLFSKTYKNCLDSTESLLTSPTRRNLPGLSVQSSDAQGPGPRRSDPHAQRGSSSFRYGPILGECAKEKDERTPKRVWTMDKDYGNELFTMVGTSDKLMLSPSLPPWRTQK